MLNKNLCVLWIKLHINNNRHFFLAFPLPMYVFQELLDCVIDILTIAGLFVLIRQQDRKRRMIDQFLDLINLIMKLLDSVTKGEPYDLVHVSTNKVKITVKVR